ncbi:glutamine-hydrolyzing GMP synthase [Candidatus Daviesbacteria bacterium]|nr:glutamine-hydrolyzing GMP synthase [Candidatus Daviesbacteria bacterium]
MVYIIDFGSQTAHLISRRIRELGASTKVINPDEALTEIKQLKPDGIIFSGGPASVYAKNAPTIDPRVFTLNIPILGICYGLQLISKILGGEVISGKKEYGPTTLSILPKTSLLSKNLPPRFKVWMSHGDEVTKLPAGFEVLGRSETLKFAFVQNLAKRLYGVQFHPEVEHTENGMQVLKNFLSICHPDPSVDEEGSKLDSSVNYQNAIKTQVQNIKDIVKEDFVIGAVSGGVDSTVAATLVVKAIGKKFIPIYIDNGLMRAGTTKWVEKIFKQIGSKPIILKVEEEMLRRLKGVTDSEKKRQIIGKFYIELFEAKMREAQNAGKNVTYLLQGTIYSDVIESQGTKHSSKIKSHHNVGGLPKKMKLKLLEPLRNFYKDEVRAIGLQLNLPKEFIFKQPFPGPGFAVRIRGEVTKDRLEKEKLADKIVLDELEKNNLLKDVFISFPVMTGSYSTAVLGDERFFGEVVALRIVQSKDVMTANFAEIPYPVLQKISSRIVNEVPGISRVVYDISTKPPATMEWE